MADSAYSFDAGATWQKEDSITVDTNRTLYIVTKDINNNISAIYTAKLDKVDNEGPEIKVQSVDKDNGVTTIKTTIIKITLKIIIKNLVKNLLLPNHL